jgi:uncharacterized RDD family membrane protein YckC
MRDNTTTYKFKTNLKKRIYATLLDYGIYVIFFFLYVDFFGHDASDGGKVVNGFLALPLLIVWFIYFVILEAFYGATPGHLVLSLKVVLLDRKEIGFEQALKRHLLDSIDILFYGIPAIIAIRNSDRHQRIGDMWAKTIVVDTIDQEQY